jgi:hypothetical protein
MTLARTIASRRPGMMKWLFAQSGAGLEIDVNDFLQGVIP